VRVVRADLNNATELATLPDAPNVIYMAGQKFGTSDAPHRTWLANVVLPARVAERYPGARIVAFSTGNVYPLVPAEGRGSREDDMLAPVGEYAMSCLGRERVFEHASQARGTRVAIMRLNYAVDLRYGVLVDIAERVRDGRAVNVTMGYANVIWQGDANAQAIRCLSLASAPPFVVNVTGPDRLRIRDVATRFGEILRKPVRLEGTEAPDALLSDTTRARDLFGEPTVSTETLVTWVGEWVGRGGTRLGKPTHFEERGGRF
jgi:nucleoside-diphosphate-sugar epimerase